MNGTASYTTTLRSSFKEDKPEVVLKPYDIGNLSMSMPFGNVPLKIGGVMYDDGSEDGCVSSLKTKSQRVQKKKEPNEQLTGLKLATFSSFVTQYCRGGSYFTPSYGDTYGGPGVRIPFEDRSLIYFLRMELKLETVQD